MAQLGAHLNSTQLNSTQLNSTQLTARFMEVGPLDLATAAGAATPPLRDGDAATASAPAPRGQNSRAPSRAADAETRGKKRADNLLKNLDLLKSRTAGVGFRGSTRAQHRSSNRIGICLRIQHPLNIYTGSEGVGQHP